jgi:NAD dependent epimerase/dehydratase
LNLKNKKVLITGAGGFVGSHLVELVVQKEAKVKALVHYNSRNDWGKLEEIDRVILKETEIFAGDLRDSDCVRKAVKGTEIVFHLGALIGIPYSYVNPRDVVDTNVLGSLNVLTAARDFHVEKVIQTSTSEVYGTAKYVPMDEKHPLNPQSPYAASKVAADQLALSFYHSFELPVAIIRPFNIYGPRQSARSVIPTIIIQALTNNQINLGSVSPTRDYTFVKDSAFGFIQLARAEKSIGQVTNLGSGFEISVEEIVKIIAKLLNKNLKVVKEKKRIRPEKSEVKRLFSDSSLAKKLFGWNPPTSLEKGLAITLEWMRKNSDNYKKEIYNI